MSTKRSTLEGVWSLDKINDELLEALDRHEEWRPIAGESENEAREKLIRCLVSHGTMRMPEYTRMSSEFRSTCERFEALRRRAKAVFG